MQPNEIQAALGSAVEEVLETMCFTGVLTSSPGAAPRSARDCPGWTAELHFGGHGSGRFRLSIPTNVAQLLGSAFLGREETEVTEEEAREVVCELANMMCGSVLSRVETKASFQLTHPEVTSLEPGGSLAGPAANRWFNLGGGIFAVSLEIQQVS